MSVRSLRHKGDGQLIYTLNRENARLKAALQTIAGGLISPENGGPDIMEMEADPFRHAMWGWSQKIAKEALAVGREL